MIIIIIIIIRMTIPHLLSANDEDLIDGVEQSEGTKHPYTVTIVTEGRRLGHILPCFKADT